MPAEAVLPPTLHGTAIALGGRGVLLLGPSGSGKSDLALRLIDEGARLVADDRVVLRAAAGRLIARAPDALRGLLEVRGIGIVTLPSLASVPLALAVDLVPPEQVERLPEAAEWGYAGISLPRLALAPFEASAPAKLRLAVGRVGKPAG